MSISDLGRTLADFSVTHLSALRGVGMSRLVFSLLIDVHPTPEYTVPLSGLMGYIYVGSSQSDVRPLAALSVETTWFTATHSQDARRDYVSVYCDLTADQLGALETLRSGASLFFKLDLRVLVQGRHALGRGDTQIWFEAAPSTWIKILKELGHVDILLLGIELPLNDVPEVLRAAAQEIRRAHQSLLAGHWDEAVRRCRLALDSIDAVLKLEQERERVLHAFFGSNRKAMTKHDRAVLVAATVRHYTHLGHHVDALGAPQDFNRHEATFIVGATASTLWNAIHQWRGSNT